jgi:hypothetical protein
VVAETQFTGGVGGIATKRKLTGWPSSASGISRRWLRLSGFQNDMLRRLERVLFDVGRLAGVGGLQSGLLRQKKVR